MAAVMVVLTVGKLVNLKVLKLVDLLAVTWDIRSVGNLVVMSENKRVTYLVL